VRIERAMELMRRGDEPVTHICYQVGFRHLSHFIRTFKKRTGLTPTAYKQTFGAKAK
ncbi:MAG: helix-turn-helix transcriptional regulator, partial [Paenibacillaceae bacterium]|nr:helix-turn-helix transcriptional regulator [Paenibacillaceae bacterium]